MVLLLSLSSFLKELSFAALPKIFHHDVVAAAPREEKENRFL